MRPRLRRRDAPWLLALALLALGGTVRLAAQEPPPAEPTGETESAETESVEIPDLSPYPTFHLLGFLAGTARSEERSGRNSGWDTSTYGLADLVATSQLSERFSALVQGAFQYTDPANGASDSSARLEQAEVRWSHSDLFKLRLGKFHTPIGYWNDQYHDIPWLRISAFRPEIYRLEEDGGILPLRSLGLQASGIATFPALDIGYTVSALTGRSGRVTKSLDLDEIGGTPGANLGITFRPTHFRRFILGASGTFDTIPKDPTLPGRNGEIDERITSGFMVFDLLNIEVLGEYVDIHHHDKLADDDFGTNGFYWQVTSRFDRWRFYQRTDVLNFATGDPFYAPIDTRDLLKYTLGARWDVKDWVGLKLEYSYTDRNQTRDSSAINFQAAFLVF